MASTIESSSPAIIATTNSRRGKRGRGRPALSSTVSICVSSPRHHQQRVKVTRRRRGRSRFTPVSTKVARRRRALSTPHLSILTNGGTPLLNTTTYSAYDTLSFNGTDLLPSCCVSGLTYTVGDFVYYHDPDFVSFPIGLIASIKPARRDQFTLTVKCFYRTNDVPDSAKDPLMERDGFAMSSLSSAKRQLLSRELFASEVQEPVVAKQLRGHCRVVNFHSLSSAASSSTNSQSCCFDPSSDPDTFFYVFAYNPEIRRVGALQVGPRIGTNYQADLPAFRHSAPAFHDCRRTLHIASSSSSASSSTFVEFPVVVLVNRGDCVATDDSKRVSLDAPLLDHDGHVNKDSKVTTGSSDDDTVLSPPKLERCLDDDLAISPPLANSQEKPPSHAAAAKLWSCNRFTEMLASLDDDQDDDTSTATGWDHYSKSIVTSFVTRSCLSANLATAGLDGSSTSLVKGVLSLSQSLEFSQALHDNLHEVNYRLSAAVHRDSLRPVSDVIFQPKSIYSWSAEEINLFAYGLRKFGKDFFRIQHSYFDFYSHPPPSSSKKSSPTSQPSPSLPHSSYRPRPTRGRRTNRLFSPPAMAAMSGGGLSHHLINGGHHSNSHYHSHHYYHNHHHYSTAAAYRQRRKSIANGIGRSRGRRRRGVKRGGGGGRSLCPPATGDDKQQQEEAPASVESNLTNPPQFYRSTGELIAFFYAWKRRDPQVGNWAQALTPAKLNALAALRLAASHASVIVPVPPPSSANPVAPAPEQQQDQKEANVLDASSPSTISPPVDDNSTYDVVKPSASLKEGNNAAAAAYQARKRKAALAGAARSDVLTKRAWIHLHDHRRAVEQHLLDQLTVNRRDLGSAVLTKQARHWPNNISSTNSGNTSPVPRSDSSSLPSTDCCPTGNDLDNVDSTTIGVDIAGNSTTDNPNPIEASNPPADAKPLRRPLPTAIGYGTRPRRDVCRNCDSADLSPGGDASSCSSHSSGSSTGGSNSDIQSQLRYLCSECRLYLQKYATMRPIEATQRCQVLDQTIKEEPQEDIGDVERVHDDSHAASFKPTASPARRYCCDSISPPTSEEDSEDSDDDDNDQEHVVLGCKRKLEEAGRQSFQVDKDEDEPGVKSPRLDNDDRQLTTQIAPSPSQPPSLDDACESNLVPDTVVVSIGSFNDHYHQLYSNQFASTTNGPITNSLHDKVNNYNRFQSSSHYYQHGDPLPVDNHIVGPEESTNSFYFAPSQPCNIIVHHSDRTRLTRIVERRTLMATTTTSCAATTDSELLHGLTCARTDVIYSGGNRHIPHPLSPPPPPRIDDQVIDIPLMTSISDITTVTTSTTNLAHSITSCSTIVSPFVQVPPIQFADSYPPPPHVPMPLHSSSSSAEQHQSRRQPDTSLTSTNSRASSQGTFYPPILYDHGQSHHHPTTTDTGRRSSDPRSSSNQPVTSLDDGRGAKTVVADGVATNNHENSLFAQLFHFYSNQMTAFMSTAGSGQPPPSHQSTPPPTPPPFNRHLHHPADPSSIRHQHQSHHRHQPNHQRGLVDHSSTPPRSLVRTPLPPTPSPSQQMARHRVRHSPTSSRQSSGGGPQPQPSHNHQSDQFAQHFAAFYSMLGQHHNHGSNQPEPPAQRSNNGRMPPQHPSTNGLPPVSSCRPLVDPRRTTQQQLVGAANSNDLVSLYQQIYYAASMQAVAAAGGANDLGFDHQQLQHGHALLDPHRLPPPSQQPSATLPVNLAGGGHDGNHGRCLDNTRPLGSRRTSPPPSTHSHRPGGDVPIDPSHLLLQQQIAAAYYYSNLTSLSQGTPPSSSSSYGSTTSHQQRRL